MSVLKNKRGVSQCEYERAFNSMYQYFKIQLNKVPIRRKKWLNTPLTDILRDVHMTTMELTTGYTEPKNKQQWRYDLITHALHRLSDLQKPLYCHWAIMQTDERHRKTWCESINTEIALLHGMQKANPCYKPDDETEVSFIMYYKTSDVETARFLSNMRDLLRYSHTKIIHASKEFNGFESDTIIELVDDAWYHCIAANQKIPETENEYRKRRSHISKAISCLHKLNRPMLSLFILVGYSEDTMREWSDLLVEEIRLLTALQKSDRKRFGSLR